MIFLSQYSRAMRPFTFVMTTVNFVYGSALYFDDNKLEFDKMKKWQYSDAKNFDIAIVRIFFFSYFKAQIYKYTAIVSMPIMAYDVYTGNNFERHFVPGSVHGYLWK